MKTKEIVLCGLFIAIGLVLPFITGQIPEIGSQLSPMHFPVFICGMVLGPKMGLIAGAITPLLRSVTFGMPPIIAASCMAFEMATYGFVGGLLYKEKKQNIYVSLIASMLVGRVVWGIASFIIQGAVGNTFGMSMFIAGAFLNAIPGIVLQILIVPVLVKALRKVV